ncbi:hypothetical protein H4Q32_018840 [Xyrichtys novacula]|uniref:Reverse transcriptase domain-containing protein n=1 Tax=Xyrichtys novacula TaxID=13765 RepID=A0AAV1GK68_XYRNO|nr:hypothetical protein H4Q32_018840 [Xyrichtys novacula]
MRSNLGLCQGEIFVNNIRLILDMIDYNEFIPDESFILFVDFYKAFDTVNHQFMFKVIRCFGFGNRFLRAVQTLYKGSNSSIKITNGTTPRFNIGRGIRQGCPLSPFLFLLVTQVMATHIKKSNFQGMTVVGREFKLAQLADDTAIFLSNQNELVKAVQCIREFSEVSGLTMNLNKSMLFPLKHCDLAELNGIPIKQTVTYLGVVLDKNEKRRSELNFEPITQQIQRKFNMWLMRDLSLHGRILLSKAEGISRSVYLSLALEMPTVVSKKLDQILFRFIWKNRRHHLKKDILSNTKRDGGLDVLTFEILNHSFKINWLSKLCREKNNLWNSFATHVFNSLGGIRFMLKCNYKIEKLPVKLSNFHKQALLSWKLIYKHNFSPTSYYIWNNEDIVYKNRSLYYKDWMEHNILLVDQLLNNHGFLLSYEEFMLKFQLPVTPKQYAVVFDALPQGVLQLLKGSERTAAIPGNYTCDIFVGGIDITKRPCSNRLLRSCLQPKTLPRGQTNWSVQLGEINWSNAWLVGEKFCLNNKVKEVSFKILHQIYPAKKTLERFKLDIEYLCDFCGLEDETISHLFYHCTYSKTFWIDVQQFVHEKTGRTISFQEKHIFIYYDDQDKDLCFFCQLILSLGKFHIHKNKWAKSKPNIALFKNELLHYAAMIKDIKNKKATKTYSIMKKFCTIEL